MKEVLPRRKGNNQVFQLLMMQLNNIDFSYLENFIY